MFINKRTRSSRSGVTLTEFVIAAGLSGLVASALLILAVSTGRSIAEIVNYVDMDHANRVALDTMTREMRQVRTITSLSSNAVVFVDRDGATVAYNYSPQNRALTRVQGLETKTLIDHCNSLRFGCYQRTPASNKYDLIPTSAITNTKVITITWSCSRQLFGLHSNTEQGQTAKIVIRNKKEL
jgi:Tfp pilus assembly protein PilW